MSKTLNDIGKNEFLIGFVLILKCNKDNAKFSEDKLEEYLNFDIDLDEHINKQYIKLIILPEKTKGFSSVA